MFFVFSVFSVAPFYEAKEYIDGEYIVVFQKNIPEDSGKWYPMKTW